MATSGVCLTAALALLAVLVVIPRVIDGAALTVLSGSMSPTIPVGSLVVVDGVEPRDLQPGDVITYQRRPNEPSLTTHRVVEVQHGTEGELAFVTKGDANDVVDHEPVPAEAVRGRVLFHVPLLGTARTHLSSVPGLLVIAGLVGVVLGWDRIVTGIRQLRARRRREASPSPTSSVTDHSQPGSEDDGPSLDSHDTTAAPGTPDAGSGVVTTRMPDTSGSALDDLRLELLVVQLQVGAVERSEIFDLLPHIGAQVVALGETDIVISIVGSRAHVDGALRLFSSYPLMDIRRARTSPRPSGPGPAGRRDDHPLGASLDRRALLHDHPRTARGGIEVPSSGWRHDPPGSDVNPNGHATSAGEQGHP